ncbi:TonB-dependent receptor [Thiohalobacter sp. COW1]|uniref:TonB-dependent receptor n=1 Tax=Thiohalobacter sp. COW1 TaxID=2795687 RepID=UPI001916C20C|nr:TonB-dependent receptor plug domain-containing protein [Thiohalobacter sp. COW1]BCO29991.1 TonB-dependent receptor [Thiohalobacter sp. COW1]
MNVLNRTFLGTMFCIGAFSLTCQVQAEQTAASPSLNGGSVVLMQADIKALNVNTVVELLNRLPGVSATDGSISLQGSASKHVLVLLDGRPLNNPVTGLVDLSGISADRLAQLKVIKGSGAVQYGDNTSGGVVLITTRSPTRKATRKVEFQYGTYNTSELSADLAATVNDTGLELGLNRESSDGHRLNGDSTNEGATFALSRTFWSVLDTRLALNLSNKESGYSGKIFDPTPRARSRKNNRGALLMAKYRDLESRTYYNTFEDKFRDPDRGLDNSLDIAVFGQEFRYSGPFSAGLEYEHQSADSTDYGTHEENRVSAFLIKRFSFSESVGKEVAAGLRVNNHSEFGVSYNPQIGFSFKPSPFDVALELNRSSNTPSFNQRYYESTFTKPNPGLDMEQATNLKASFSYAAGDAVSLSLSGFYSKVDDAIAYSANGDGTYSYQNIASSMRRGADVGLDWRITPVLKLNASYLYLRFTDDATGLDLPHKPRHKAKLDLDATAGKTLLTLTGNWVSDSYDDKQNTVVQAGRFTADAKAAYSFGNTKLLFSVENLFDEEYESHVGYPAAGRTFMAGIRHPF